MDTAKPLATLGIADAKTHFCQLAETINATGKSVTIFKHNKPFVEIRPVSSERVEVIDWELPKETQEAMEEEKRLRADPKAKRYTSVRELFADAGL